MERTAGEYEQVPDGMVVYKGLPDIKNDAQ